MLMYASTVSIITEQRKFYRIILRQKSYFQPIDTAKTSFPQPCLIMNVSSGGISFEIATPQLIEGDIIILMFRFGAVIREDKVRIVHVEKIPGAYRFGAVFCEPDHQRDELITGLCR